MTLTCASARLDVAGLGDQVLNALSGKAGGGNGRAERAVHPVGRRADPHPDGGPRYGKNPGADHHRRWAHLAQRHPGAGHGHPGGVRRQPGAGSAAGRCRRWPWMAPAAKSGPAPSRGEAGLAGSGSARPGWQRRPSCAIQPGQRPSPAMATGSRWWPTSASLPDVELALKNGAEGIGLLRTEFLFLTAPAPPPKRSSSRR